MWTRPGTASYAIAFGLEGLDSTNAVVSVRVKVHREGKTLTVTPLVGPPGTETAGTPSTITLTTAGTPPLTIDSTPIDLQLSLNAGALSLGMAAVGPRHRLVPHRPHARGDTDPARPP